MTAPLLVGQIRRPLGAHGRPVAAQPLNSAGVAVFVCSAHDLTRPLYATYMTLSDTSKFIVIVIARRTYRRTLLKLVSLQCL